MIIRCREKIRESLMLFSKYKILDKYKKTHHLIILINYCSLGCSNNIGSFECECVVGFSGDGIICADIDECSNNPCMANRNVCQQKQGVITHS